MLLRQLSLVLLSLLACQYITHANVQFPSSGNYVDVTNYGAVPNDGNDDTAAIQAAITASIGQKTSLKTVYLPNGTYNLSDTLHWRDNNGDYSAYLSLQGQSESGVILQLDDNTFTDTANPKAVIFTASNPGGGSPDPNGEGNTAFSNYIQDLTIDTGTGNTGAIGIDHLANNAGAIRNVTIKSGDTNGIAGIYLGRSWPGPWLLKNATIDGYNYAMDFDDQTNYSTTVDGLTIRNQKIAGIRNNKHPLTIRNLHSDNLVPVLINGSDYGLTCILDSVFTGGSTSESAIKYLGALYLRNISISGYKAQPIFEIATSTDKGSSFIDEYLSHGATSEFTSPARSMQLPVEEIPATPDEPYYDWVVVGGFNDANIQAAIDQANATGKKTVFLPAGQYNLTNPITISGSVERLYGFGAYLNWDPVTENSNDKVFTFENSTAPAFFFEHVTFSDPRTYDFLWIQDNASTPFVFRDILLLGRGELYANSVTDGSKKIFIENCAIGRSTFTGAKVWAWQLDPEDDNYKIINDGSQMWLFGYKCEWANTNLINQNGARTEIIGGFFYPPGGSNPGNGGIGIINNESELTAIFTYSGEYNEVMIRDTRNGVTRDYTRTESQAAGHPRFGNTMPLYTSWEAIIPVAPTNLTASATGSHSINLTWTDNATTETGYLLEKHNGSESWSIVSDSISVNATSYTDTTVASSTTYEYRLRAKGDPVHSNLSNIASATTSVASTAPAAPGSLTATSQAESITLSWNDNSSNEDKFRIERKTGSGGTWGTLAEVAINTINYADTTLTEGQQYYYRAIAINTAGTATSNEANATFNLRAPSSLTAIKQASHLQLIWEDNSSQETSYLIERRLSGDTWAQLTQSAANSTLFFDYDLKNNSSYEYRVKATGSNGDSNYSNTASTNFTKTSAPFIAERFNSSTGDSFDLVTTSITFRYRGGSEYDTYIDKSVATFPVDYSTHSPLPLDDNTSSFQRFNNWETITLGSGKTIPFNGVDYSTLTVVNDGIIQFGSGTPLLTQASQVDFTNSNNNGVFDILRGIAAQAGTLSPDAGGVAGSYYGAQLSDRYVVTWVNVEDVFDKAPMDCQTEIYFNGDIRITWQANAQAKTLVGISAGTGQPDWFTESDFSDYTAEPTLPFMTTTATVVSVETVDIKFTEQVDITTAQDTANYTLDNSMSVNTATVLADGKTVRLNSSTLPTSTDVTLTLSGIKNTTNTTIPTATRTLNYDPGLFLHYPFDDGTGTTANDISGSNDGTLNGSPSFVAGKYNTALDFGNSSATDEWVASNNSITLNQNDTLTATAWIKLEGTLNSGDSINILSQQDGSGTGRTLLSVTNDASTYRLQSYIGGSQTLGSSATITQNAWHHVALVTQSGSTKLYVNGTLAGSSTNALEAANGSLIVGHHKTTSSSPNNQWDGLIDEIKLYSQALSGTQIQQQYNDGLSITTHTVTLNTTTNGTIQLNPNLTDFAEGTSVEVTANPATGYILSSWSGDLSGSTSPTNIVVDANKTIGATFIPDPTIPDVLESFDYTEIMEDPNVADDGLSLQNGGIGWNGGWYNASSNDWHVESPGLAHPQAIAASGNSTYRQGGKAARALATPLGNNDGSTVYMSFLMRAQGTDTTTAYNALNLNNGGDADGNRSFEVGILADSSGQFVAGNRNIGKTVQLGAVDTATHQIVIEFTFNTSSYDDLVKIWLDPTAYSDTPATLTGLDVSFDRILLSSWSQNISFDEIRISDSWVAVTSATAPSSLTGNDLLAHALGASSANTLPAALPTITTSGSTLTYQIADTSASNVLYEAEISTDLSSWICIATKPISGSWSKDNGSTYPNLSDVTVTPSGSGVNITHGNSTDKYFLRLKVSQ